MRIVGLPEFQSSALRPNAASSPVGPVLPSQRAAAETRDADKPVTVSLVSAGASAPVDKERVAEIRKALENDSYPLVPAEIADAIIAAGLYGKVGK
jgi:negative regulator of flagellin synthesis FlgM